MLMLTTTLIAFAGLTYDAGMAFNARREATNVAASAARAGADVISVDALYQDGVPRLSPDAEGVAANTVRAAGLTVLESRRESDFELLVRTELVHETTFLKILGIGSLTVDGEATALVESRANR